MKIEIKKMSPLAEKIFPSDELTQICSGFVFTEGPIWDIKADCLYFTDFQKLQIWKWTEKEGAKLYTEKSNRAIGLSMDASGRIVSTESQAHAISYVNHEKSEIIVNKYQGKQLNSPNDVVVSKKGFIYFTDPYSDMMRGPKELGFNGIFVINPRGEISLVDDTFTRPNGIALSPDESILYANDTAKQEITAFYIDENGKVKSSAVFAKVDSSYGPGAVDGMKVDVEGNVYVTGPCGIWVFSPSGETLAVLHIPEKVGNFCFGGNDNKTLYITASTSVYTLRVEIAGIVPVRN
jgi:gluconolactonase